ncbi:MAG: uracil-DNA glycosylase [Actinobacteria bacterium]|nr:uracil-DNA glycosylase [Actinomycetota bacterium]
MEWLGLSQLREKIKMKLDQKIIKCRACPRLVDWREEISIVKRKAYQDEKYWGKPVPGFGPDDARVLVVGLAPGAHGANRTGRIFTGDSSGDWLYRSLHKNGLAKLETSKSRDDGQELFDTRITCAVHCAPPGNKPNLDEIEECSHWLNQEFKELFPTTRAYLVLGGIAWKATLKALSEIGEELPRKRPKFSHGANFKFRGSDGNIRLVIGSYHPSQQNTFTGKLTRSQLDSVVRKAGRFAHAGKPL